MPDFDDQHRERAILEGMLQALALDGRVRTVEEPSTQLRAQVVEKMQLSCLILPINTGSELFSRVCFFSSSIAHRTALHEMKMSDQIATCGTEGAVEKRSIHIISIASHSIEPIA